MAVLLRRGKEPSSTPRPGKEESNGGGVVSGVVTGKAVAHYMDGMEASDVISRDLGDNGVPQ